MNIFQSGDRVRMVTSRNYHDEEVNDRGQRYGYEIGSEHILVEIDPVCSKTGIFDGWRVETGGWVRSDDIELVSRAEEPVKLAEETYNHHIEDIKQILEPIPFGTIHFGPDSKIKIEPEFNDYEDPYVRLKIKKSTWDAEELAGLVDYLENVIHVLEGELPGESGECLACKIEDLMDSNERLSSANEAKRERLAKIRELTEE